MGLHGCSARWLGASAALAAIAVLGASAAWANASASNGAIVAAINHERAANGIPTVTENAVWSRRCRAHDEYMSRNSVLGHTENMARPAASKAGAWAASNSILASSSWLAGNPYANAPIHLIQLMNPLLRSVGVDEHGGFTCTTTWPGIADDRGSAPKVYSYPSDGATGVPYAEAAVEFPFTPASALGLGKTTGFNVMVWAVGLPGARIVAASLTGPGGARVALKAADVTHRTLGEYLPAGSAFLIPVAPLAPATRYTASVSFGDGSGTRAGRTWRFTTAAAPADVELAATTR
jgi:hypothetical protein